MSVHQEPVEPREPKSMCPRGALRVRSARCAGPLAPLTGSHEQPVSEVRQHLAGVGGRGQRASARPCRLCGKEAAVLGGVRAEGRGGAVWWRRRRHRPPHPRLFRHLCLKMFSTSPQTDRIYSVDLTESPPAPLREIPQWFQG